MAALRRLVPQLRHASTAVVSASKSVVGGSAPKVLDSTVRLTAIHEESGQRFIIRGTVGQSLLKALVRGELIESGSHRQEDITSCGAECEVSVAGEWLEKLPERTDEEVEILTKHTAKGQNLDIHTRLACQIVLDRSLDGMAFAVPEARPWKSN